MYKVSKYLLMTFGFAAPIMSKLNSYKVCNSTSNNTYIQIQTIGTPCHLPHRPHILHPHVCFCYCAATVQLAADASATLDVF